MSKDRASAKDRLSYPGFDQSEPSSRPQKFLFSQYQEQGSFVFKGRRRDIDVMWSNFHNGITCDVVLVGDSISDGLCCDGVIRYSLPGAKIEDIIDFIDSGYLDIFKKFLLSVGGNNLDAWGNHQFQRVSINVEMTLSKSRDEGTAWVTSSVASHRDCELYEACLFIAIGRTWTLWHVDFDPASSSVTTVVCGWKLWLICTQTELGRELCRDSGRLEDLLKLLQAGGSRLKRIQWAIQRPGDSIILPWGLAHCVITLSDKRNAATTAMLSYVVNGSHKERMEREAWINMRFASDYRKGSNHGN